MCYLKVKPCTPKFPGNLYHVDITLINCDHQCTLAKNQCGDEVKCWNRDLNRPSRYNRKILATMKGSVDGAIVECESSSEYIPGIAWMEWNRSNLCGACSLLDDVKDGVNGWCSLETLPETLKSMGAWFVKERMIPDELRSCQNS